MTFDEKYSQKENPGHIGHGAHWSARVAPEKNTLYAIQCLKALAGNNNVALDFYGQIYNQAYWQDCLTEMQQLPPNITVTHKGFIEPEEIPSIIKEYHALLLPTRGENFGHVILESFMAGRSVLISDQTPWRDLQVKKAGWDPWQTNSSSAPSSTSWPT